MPVILKNSILHLYKLVALLSNVHVDEGFKLCLFGLGNIPLGGGAEVQASGVEEVVEVVEEEEEEVAKQGLVGKKKKKRGESESEWETFSAISGEQIVPFPSFLPQLLLSSSRPRLLCNTSLLRWGAQERRRKHPSSNRLLKYNRKK